MMSEAAQACFLLNICSELDLTCASSNGPLKLQFECQFQVVEFNWQFQASRNWQSCSPKESCLQNMACTLSPRGGLQTSRVVIGSIPQKAA